MGFVIVEPIIEAFIPKKTKIVFNSQIWNKNQTNGS
jgi:hypothetical protein